jgi:hypothetical protein
MFFVRKKSISGRSSETLWELRSLPSSPKGEPRYICRSRNGSSKMFALLARFISLQAPGGPEPALPNTGVATNGHGNRPPGEVSSIVSSLAGKHGPQTLTSARLRPAFCLPVCLRAHALHATRHSPPSIWRWRRCGVDTRAACRWAACAGSGWCANVVPRARKRSLFALCLRPIRLRAPAALMSTSRQ